MKTQACNERREAMEILKRVLYEDAYASALLLARFRANPQWGERERGLITNLVYTVLTHSLRLEAFINKYATIPVRRMKPQVAVVLMVSAAQLLWMDRIPPHAVVDEAVKLILASPQRNLSGFVNGVLRAMLRENLRESWPEANEDMLAHLSVRYSIPRWILEMWEKAYGLEMTKRFARNLTIPRDLSLRCNTLRTDPETLYQDLVKELGEGNVGRGHVCAEALTCKKSGDISHWEAFRRGHVIVQDESSMLTVYALDPQPGERVLDLCAAPGGKSTHMVQRMQNQGLVESRDLYDHKLGQIRENANRLGCTILETKRSDASRAYAEDREAWDRVLLDAPCSGLGIIRNKPDLKLHRKPEDVESLAALQREMLQAAAQCVRPGGVLVYSTCTLSPRENEDNVAWFLDQHPEFVPERLEGILPAGFPPSQIHPSYTYVLPEKDFFDGFFLARFYKKR